MSAPIRVRMTAWYVALLAVILVAVGAFVVLRLQDDLVSATDRSLRPAVHQIATGYRHEGLPEFTDQSATVLPRRGDASQVLASTGVVVRAYGGPAGAAPMLSPARVAQVLGSGPTVRTGRLGAGGLFRIAAEPVTRGGRRQVVVAATSLVPMQRAVHRVISLLLLALPVAVLVAAAGGWALARRAMRPIDRMIGTAGSIGPAALDERVPVPASDDEVARLGRTLNTMLDRIQRGVDQQRRLVADTAHELRTPLAAMRTELDVTLCTDRLSPPARSALEGVREEVDRMSATVDDLLVLALADEQGLPTAREPLDLRELALRTADRLAPLATRRGVAVVVEGPPAPLRGDPGQLGQALRNLLDNAIAFSPPGGRVTVRTGAAGGSVTVTVEDEGVGIPEEARDRVFDRFFRVDGSRARATGGSGLGLSIALEVVRAHGGRISVAGREPGSAFMITLPA
ncbi:MAG: sensor histidine kinase [Frankiaceae bacterium]